MKRADIEREARKVVGAPWVHQGRDITAGVDCLGVLIFVCQNLGVDIQDYTNYSREPDGVQILSEMRKYFNEIPLEESREGDILIFRMAGEHLPRHVGIITKGTNEYMLVHSIEVRSTGHTVEETLRRWMRFRTNAFQFRGLEDI